MNNFKSKMMRAQTMREVDSDNQDYWSGYSRGLRRTHHGSNFGTSDEHNLWLTATGDPSRDARSKGYRDGFYDRPPNP